MSEETVLLISNIGLTSREFSELDGNAKWDSSNIREWLNGDFISLVFTSEEQEDLVESEILPDKNPQYSKSDSGEATNDRVFILSASEILKYWPEEEGAKYNLGRIVKVSPMAKAEGAFTVSDEAFAQYEEGTPEDIKGAGFWWVRTPGQREGYLTHVWENGLLNYAGVKGDTKDISVRPVVCVKYYLEDETAEEGSIEDGELTENGEDAPKSTTTPTPTTGSSASGSSGGITVSFDAKGGTSTKSITVEYGKKYSLPSDPTKTGYKFLGWYTQSSGGTKISNGDTVYLTSGTTLYAHWEAKKVNYTINYYVKDGKTYSKVDSKKTTAKADSSVTLKTLAKEFKAFPSSSYKSGNVGTKATSTPGTDVATAKIQADGKTVINLYYSPSKFTLHFDVNGGNALDSKESDIQYSVGKTYGSLPSPTKDYYKFEGWYTEKSGGTKITKSDTASAKLLTVYAHWKENEESDWRLSTNVPNNIKVTAEKWVYTLTEQSSAEKKTSDGWVKVAGAGRWEPLKTVTVKTAIFPNGYSKDDQYYKDYANSRPAETDTIRIASSETKGSSYIYWHWMYKGKYATGLEKSISAMKGKYADEKGKERDFSLFYAFESKENCPNVGTSYSCNSGMTTFNCVGVIPKTSASGVGTDRFFRIDVTEIEYSMEYFVLYERVTEGKESKKEVTAGTTEGTNGVVKVISNVQKYVKYIKK